MKVVARARLALQLLGAEGSCRRGAPGYTRYQTHPYFDRGAHKSRWPPEWTRPGTPDPYAGYRVHYLDLLPQNNLLKIDEFIGL